MWASIDRFIRRGVALGVVITSLPSGVCATPTPAPAVTPEPEICPISVLVSPLKGQPGVAVFSLWADGTAGVATGSIVAYAGGLRYTIPFAKAIAADIRRSAVLPTPIPVRFPTATSVESAYVSALGTDECPIREPYESAALTGVVQTDGPPAPVSYVDWSTAWVAFQKRAAEAVAEPAPAGEPADALTCTKPYARQHLLRGENPIVPPIAQQRGEAGTVTIRVSIAADGSLLGARVDLITRGLDEFVIRAALEAARKTTYAPGIYRCRPVGGTYLFLVQFGVAPPVRADDPTRWTSSP